MNLSRDLPREVLDNLDPVKRFELEAMAKIVNRLDRITEIDAKLSRMEARI